MCAPSVAANSSAPAVISSMPPEVSQRGFTVRTSRPANPAASMVPTGAGRIITPASMALSPCTPCRYSEASSTIAKLLIALKNAAR